MVVEGALGDRRMPTPPASLFYSRPLGAEQGQVQSPILFPPFAHQSPIGSPAMGSQKAQ